MPIKHFLKLKIETNQETWVMITRYKLASTLYQLHKDFQYIISKKFIKTKQQKIHCYYDDIITYIKQQKNHTQPLMNNPK